MLDITLIDILDKTENIKLSREFKYIEQQAIIGKASIVAGSENLKRYPLTIKLHSDFCNPQKIIDEVEAKGKAREAIQYFQGSKYIGAYVIESYNSTIVQKFNDVVIYAELELTLLEDSIHDEIFKPNEKKTVDLGDIASFDEGSINIQAIAPSKERLSFAFDNALNKCSSALSGVEKAVGQRLTRAIIDDVKSVGVAKLFEVTNKTLDNVGPSTSYELQNAIREVPKTALTSYLR